MLVSPPMVAWGLAAIQRQTSHIPGRRLEEWPVRRAMAAAEKKSKNNPMQSRRFGLARDTTHHPRYGSAPT
jgi:hypothetical protein